MSYATCVVCGNSKISFQNDARHFIACAIDSAQIEYAEACKKFHTAPNSEKRSDAYHKALRSSRTICVLEDLLTEISKK